MDMIVSLSFRMRAASRNGMEDTGMDVMSFANVIQKRRKHDKTVEDESGTVGTVQGEHPNGINRLSSSCFL